MEHPGFSGRLADLLTRRLATGESFDLLLSCLGLLVRRSVYLPRLRRTTADKYGASRLFGPTCRLADSPTRYWRVIRFAAFLPGIVGEKECVLTPSAADNCGQIWSIQ